MKFKYYLRGAGIGIIVATIIIMISGVLHNDEMSNEEIIEEAKKLGMVMAETETEIETELETETESETETEPETEIETEEDSETDESTNTQKVEDGSTVTITVEMGDYTRQVAEKLYEAGLVDDAEAFRAYVGQKGLGQNISVGTYEIPVGATYDEIIAIITF